MIRPTFRKAIERNVDLTGSVWAYSIWIGYLSRSVPLRRLERWAEIHNIPIRFIHTSGHAKLFDLEKLASALSPNALIPIHSFHVEQFDRYFQNVKLLQDNEAFEV